MQFHERKCLELWKEAQPSRKEKHRDYQRQEYERCLSDAQLRKLEEKRAKRAERKKR